MEKLEALLNQGATGLSTQQVAAIVDITITLLRDNNFRACIKALQALSSTASAAGEHLKLHLNVLLPPVVERLGDSKKSIRDAAYHLLLALMEISCSITVIEKAGNYAWTHKNWRVREQFSRVVSSAINLFSAAELPFQQVLMPKIFRLLEDSHNTVREAAILCIQELYRQYGCQVKEALQAHQFRASQLKDILERFDKIEPGKRSIEDTLCQLSKHDIKSCTGSYVEHLQKGQSSIADLPKIGTVSDSGEKKSVAVKVNSEKELMREMEKAASLLVLEQDWSVRIAAMERVEGLVLGGATEYAYFPALLKQLVEPIILQLSDRRSGILKQACTLLSFLSQEMLLDFEPFAEAFIPALCKLVAIKVQVIAESADNCIKNMLRHCRVARIIPHIVDAAKNDRNASLRARCCEYIVNILEQWPDVPDVLKYVEQFEDVIRCCTSDSTSEVRAIARQSYLLFKRIWPDRSQSLLATIHPTAQKILAEEETKMSNNSDKHLASEERSTLRSRRSTQDYHKQDHKSGNLEAKSSNGICDVSMHSTTYNNVQQSVLSQAKDESLCHQKNMEGYTNMLLVKTSSTTNSNTKCNPIFSGSMFSENLNEKILNAKLSSASINYPRIDKRSVTRAKGAANRPFAYKELNRTLDQHIGMLQDQILHKKKFEGKTLPSSSRALICLTPEQSSSTSSFETLSSHQSDFMTLRNALNDGMSSQANWCTKVAAFNFIAHHLQKGVRGIQEVTQSFDAVMNLFSQHLEDAHSKVAEAALLALVQVTLLCPKLFEMYLERTLPQVFARLTDTKNVVRQLGAKVLEVVANVYSLEILLPALLRSLEEQRSTKAKGAVISFATNGLIDIARNNQILVGLDGALRLWLCKLALLASDKSPRLKESAITGIISVYSHLDSNCVVNFILSLPIEEQSVLRRALRQYTPNIEADLVNHLQNRNQRPKCMPSTNQTPSTSERDNLSISRGSSNRSCDTLATSTLSTLRNLARSTQDESKSTKVGSTQAGSAEDESKLLKNNATKNSRDHATTMIQPGYDNDLKKMKDSESFSCISKECIEAFQSGRTTLLVENPTSSSSLEMNCSRPSSAPHVDEISLARVNEAAYKRQDIILEGRQMRSKVETKCGEKNIKISLVKSLAQDLLSTIPEKVWDWSTVKSLREKREILQIFLQLTHVKGSSIWSKYMKHIATIILEALIDQDATVRELDLMVIHGLLKDHGEKLQEINEELFRRLVPLTRDPFERVATQAQTCLGILVSYLEPKKCLEAFIPHLMTNDEKLLITCIKYIKKLISHLSAEDLMAQLPYFSPTLFKALGNQNANVRKIVVLCLVDIYIILGSAFIPYLGSLTSTQLRLVTIYANRISQARTQSIPNASE